MMVKGKVEERVESLPDSVLDCEACGGSGTMQIRRSSLNKQFYADDVLLKCRSCYCVRTHGIAFEDPEQFEEELEHRDSRIIDFARDSHDPSETLKALGYIGKSKVV